jgi:enoyl-CoA hydratase/carnithine racemase
MSPRTPRLTQFTVTSPEDGYWRVTFDNPPANLMNATTAEELQRLVDAIETTEDLRVVVFDSAHPDYFFARYDFSGGGLPDTPGPTGLPPFLDMTVRLAAAPVVTIAAIRGRARGGGNEFALACDLRFASLEKALFGQPEIGSGLIPGGGGIERLATLVGRGRALEIVLGGNDFDAATAERYGWINRAVPDADFDDFVDTFARRIASFDSAALSLAKSMIDRHTRPDPKDLLESQRAGIQLTATPGFQTRFQRLRRRSAAAGAEFELRMGHYIGPDEPDR